MEIVTELLLELLIQIVGEVLFELGLHSLAEPFRRPPNPWIAAVGYLLFGAMFGGVSLWLFPHYMVAGPVLRWVNLLTTPLAVGAGMSRLGAWRASRGQALMRIDRFWYGYLFAVSFAVVRFVWAT
jgi:hypothetical protein